MVNIDAILTVIESNKNIEFFQINLETNRHKIFDFINYVAKQLKFA